MAWLGHSELIEPKNPPRTLDMIILCNIFFHLSNLKKRNHSPNMCISFGMYCIFILGNLTVTSNEHHHIYNHWQFDCLFKLVETINKENIRYPHYWPFVVWIHWYPVDSPHKEPLMWKVFLISWHHHEAVNWWLLSVPGGPIYHIWRLLWTAVKWDIDSGSHW